MTTLDGFHVKRSGSIAHYDGINRWSIGVRKRVPVYEGVGLKPCDITHSGRTVHIADYNMFVGLMQQWSAELGRDKAVKTFFDCA